MWAGIDRPPAFAAVELCQVDAIRLADLDQIVWQGKGRSVAFADLVTAICQDRERQLLALCTRPSEFLQLGRQYDKARSQRIYLRRYYLESIQLMPAVGSSETAEHAH
jgi:hypothetical protein